MYTYQYSRPSVTATIFAFYNNMLVVGTRSDNTEAFAGHQCIPGGFLNAKTTYFEGETVEQTAIREFKEECGIDLDGEQLILFHEHSKPDTDPRAHVVNLCYIVNLKLEQIERLAPGDDLKALDLVSWKNGISTENWAFNHRSLLALAVFVWENGGDYFQSKGIWG